MTLLPADAEPGADAHGRCGRALAVIGTRPETAARAGFEVGAHRELRAVGGAVARHRAHVADAPRVAALIGRTARLAEPKVEAGRLIAIAGDQKQGKRDSGSQHASSWGPICSPVKTPRRGEPQEPDAWR